LRSAPLANDSRLDRHRHVAVETSGRLTSAMSVVYAPSENHPENARIALKVDSARAERFIVECMMN
jgi:inosine-uridine nucleoside N-ribohydrolase